MRQPDLFEPTETLLADDERGRISYVPHFVNAEAAASWFRELRATVNWHAERRMMYDREVDVPRLMAHFRLDLPADDTPTAILEAARRVHDRLHVAFTGVGLNLYRDGRDSVAPHNDHLNELRTGCPIALVSLGATRRMTIGATSQPRRVMHVDLEAGSLLVMDYATQLHYTHGVPKTTARVGERISLAFRVKQNRPAGESGRDEVYR